MGGGVTLLPKNSAGDKVELKLDFPEIFYKV